MAIPALGTGIYLFPHNHAAKMALQAVQNFNTNHPGELKRIRFVLEKKDFDAYMSVLRDCFQLQNLPTLANIPKASFVI